MSKALYGHLVAADPRLVSEVARLRLRVAELERENADLRSRVILERAALEEVVLDDALRERPTPALA